MTVGKLVAFDYGHGPDDWPAANQPDGTVRGYREQKLVDEVLSELGEVDISQMGRIIGAVMAKGDGIDGSIVSKLVKEKLS